MTFSMIARSAGVIALAALISTSTAPVNVAAQGDANQLVPLNAYKDLKWRSVGATRGGRVTAYSGVRQQPHTFYFGGVGGGVWKTDDAGITWAPISDGQIARPDRSDRSTWRRRTRITCGSAPAARRFART